MSIFAREFRLLFILCLIFLNVVRSGKVVDPFDIFCGAKDCYDVLGINRTATVQEIKKAYRRMSLQYHPDKNKDEDSATKFREISKANEVLSDPEQRDLFNYYLDHPREYYKVSGQYYFRQLPKADVRVIIFGLILFFSVLLPVTQHHKWQSALRYLRHATSNNLGLKSGGTKQTQELYRRAVEQYEIKLKEAKANGDKAAGKLKMSKDPVFLKIVDELVNSISIEGGYRKPTWDDVLLVQIFKSPYWLYLAALKYHKKHFSKAELSSEEKREMLVEIVTAAVWNNLEPEDQEEVLEMDPRQPQLIKEWLKDRDLQEQQRNAAAFKKYRRHKKKIS